MLHPDLFCITDVGRSTARLWGRKDSEAFSDGALGPAQAQKALKVLVCPFGAQLFQANNFSEAVPCA